MSKLTTAFVRFSWAILMILQLFYISNAQSIDAEITVDSKRQSVVVSGRFLRTASPSAHFNFYFITSPAGQGSTADRISDVRLFDRDGRAIDFKRLAPGEYLASGEFSAWSYRVPLAASKMNAHSSWITNDYGMIMLDDLLPKTGKGQDHGARVTLKLPADWQISSLEKRGAGEIYEVADTDKAILYVGSGLRTQSFAKGGVSINITFKGEWLFTDLEAVSMANEIFVEYRKIFGVDPAAAIQIALLRLPKDIAPGTWQAETRGRNITLVSSDTNFRTQSLQRLHEQLRHEIFHLWIPNAVNLTGSYDWFYEGFALYQSLKLAVSVNRIRFDDFLDTLSRAHSIDSRQTRRLSLIEASRNRFRGNDTQIYARGMLVAFLSDISLLERSKGKVSVADLLRKLVSVHGQAEPSADATAAVIGVMNTLGVPSEIVEKYVRGSEPIAWNDALRSVGIEPLNEQKRLSVISKPNGRQKLLLDKLGYNNWRKLSSR